ncbi:MAG: RNA polymerase factor sigma-54 [Tabrizicola sp.]|jgi:RNA polymerase sigma-54 factor|nr:RNA polymerase factor sigma-54 [Tabrizicola sp.]
MKHRSRITVQQTQRLTLTTTLAASIRLLRADAAGLNRYLEEQAAENPNLILTRPVPSDWTPRWRSAFGSIADPAETAAATPSLIVHVRTQIEAQRLSAADTRIAEALVGALEPSGWLAQSCETIARHLGVTQVDVNRVLARLQARIEPTGLFARNLAECLRLQAVEAGELDAVMQAVLNRLQLVAQGEIDRLAREAGVASEEVRARIGQLRSYDPKPGAKFEALAAPIREPDLIVEKGPNGWAVALNRSALPTVTLAPGRGGTGRAEARALVRMIEGRNATLFAVAQEILHRQTAALDNGPGALVPMTMADVAEALGLHESTISRVVAGTAVDTPHGTWWLRSLFSQAVQEGGPAASALRDRLARLVASEDPAAPLSDARLAEELSAGGAPIARRTVAKYRAMLNLPPAHRRRQRR